MVFGESALKDLYRKIVWGPYREALGRLPPGAELRFNRRLGRLALRASPEKKAKVLENLRRGLPELSDPEDVVRRVFETHFADQYISWSFARIAGGEGDAYLRIEGMRHLEEAIRKGRGVVLMHPHMGPAQLPLCVLGAKNYRMNQIGGGGVAGEISEEGRRATELRHRLEQDIPARIWDGGRFLRPVLRALAEGELVMSAVDGTGGGKELGRRIVCTVLGQRMRVPVGAVWLALQSGAPLLPLVTFRNPGMGPDYITEIRPELAIERDLPMSEALALGAEVVAIQLERWLREHPGDWHFWDEFEPGKFLEPA